MYSEINLFPFFDLLYSKIKLLFLICNTFVNCLYEVFRDVWLRFIYKARFKDDCALNNFKKYIFRSIYKNNITSDRVILYIFHVYVYDIVNSLVTWPMRAGCKWSHINCLYMNVRYKLFDHTYVTIMNNSLTLVTYIYNTTL